MDKILSGVKNIHLIGIGGIGVSGLALLLKDKGYTVKGSDIQDTYNTKMLKEAGIEVYIGHKSENISPDTGLVCYSSAVKSDNPEILEAVKRGITILARGKLLGLLTFDKKTIAVSGSHGKTTTTALSGYLLTALGYKPTVFVGGLPLNYERNAWWGEEYFVIETDESDGSFLCYNPWVSIITNIDHEHLDYHKDMESLKKSFLQFAYQTKGLVIGCADDPSVNDILSKVNGLSYGFSERNRISGENISFEAGPHLLDQERIMGFTCFDFLIDKKFVSRVKVPLLGIHNVLNTMAVLSFFSYLGEDLAKVIELLKYFKGTKRRFQIKKKVAGVTFIDDYAHHPTEINAVIKAARYLNPRRVFVIFQPHRFSRVKSLYKEFSHCFSCADELILTDIYSASEKEIEGVNSEFLLGEIKKIFQGNVRYICREKIAAEVSLSLEEGDVVLGLGAGDINAIMDGIIHEFKNSRVKA
ncbi:MAG: UDP-N-acetylmuramate--L-alanine ligase [Candidatus Omnitrophota bacterium]|nr:UDP-N-acetylmuramate--L-alanine ligase [Candidatus Omnitrophota bacterium]